MSYKKAWLKKEFDNGYVFRRIDERVNIKDAGMVRLCCSLLLMMRNCREKMV